MFASEAEGELPKGTAKRWANETEKKKGGIEALPEKVKPSKKTASAIAGVILEKRGDAAGRDYAEEPEELLLQRRAAAKNLMLYYLNNSNSFQQKKDGVTDIYSQQLPEELHTQVREAFKGYRPFPRKEASVQMANRIGALSSFVKNAANPFYDDGRQSERLDPKTVGLLSALPIDVLGPIASGLGAPKGRGAAAVGGNIVGQLGGAALGAGAGVGLGSLGALLGIKDPELLQGILGGAGLLAGKGIGGGYGYHLATKDAVRKEAACASSPSSSKPKKMKKSPKEIANKVWTSKKK
jgi:hypothetical protein